MYQLHGEFEQSERPGSIVSKRQNVAIVQIQLIPFIAWLFA
jgi:hypothetical protein